MSSGELYNQAGDAGLERLNMKSRDELLQEAERIRHAVIDSCYEAFLLFARVDQTSYRDVEDRGFPEGETLACYVLRDFLAAPVHDRMYLTTWSIKLINDTALDEGEVSSDDQLLVYMPVPYLAANLERFNIDDLPKPDRIFIERRTVKGPPKRYELTHERLLSYKTAADTGRKQEHEADDLGQWLFHSLVKRADSRLPTVTQLQEDLINMKVVPQRYAPVGGGTALNE